jgi:hypothetical protein
MCYRKHLRQVRRARHRTKVQQRMLLTLELEGFVALTLHTITEALTVPIEREVGAQVADTLREALRERRRALKTEAGQLRRDGGENAYRQGKVHAVSATQPTAATPPPTEDLTDQAPPPGEERAPQS